MKTTVEKFFTTEDGSALLVEFDCDVTAATLDYFCNGHGNWLPGDAAECKITEVRVDGVVVVGEIQKFILGKYSFDVINRALKQAEAA